MTRFRHTVLSFHLMGFPVLGILIFLILAIPAEAAGCRQSVRAEKELRKCQNDVVTDSVQPFATPPLPDDTLFGRPWYGRPVSR